ncbi:hypothetical protein V6Z11_D06G102200 [Gossypium hirsutum]
MLLLLICGGVRLHLNNSFSNYAGNGNGNGNGNDKENVAGFWRPMGILNPNSKGKKELYSHRICCFLLVLR